MAKYKDLLGFTLTLIVVIIYVGVGVTYLWNMDHRTVRYNCDIAEISPDIPLEVKEQCRKLRSGRI